VKPSRLTVVSGEAPWTVGTQLDVLPVLSAEQLRVLHAVQGLYERSRPLGCTVREVALAAGLRDQGLTHRTILSLVESGYLTYEPGKPRALVPRFR
jgi:hypothetical protein